MIRLALALAVIGLGRPVSADPAAATRLAAEADAAAAANDFKLAAARFAAAYKEDPTRNDVFCNIGISHFKAGDLPRAHLLLTLCVQRSALELAFKDNANAVIASIEQQLRAERHTPVTVNPLPANATVSVVGFGDESQWVGPRTIWLPFGSHQLVARLEGYLPRTTVVEAVDQKPTSVEIRLDKEAVVVVPPPPKPREAPPGRPSKALPVVASAITIAAVVVGAIAFSKAKSEADRGEFALDQEALDAANDQVSKWNLILGTSGSIAVIGAAASGYLWYRATRSTSTTVEVTPTAGGAAAMLRGRF